MSRARLAETCGTRDKIDSSKLGRGKQAAAIQADGIGPRIECCAREGALHRQCSTDPTVPKANVCDSHPERMQAEPLEGFRPQKRRSRVNARWMRLRETRERQMQLWTVRYFRVQPARVSGEECV